MLQFNSHTPQNVMVALVLGKKAYLAWSQRSDLTEDVLILEQGETTDDLKRQILEYELQENYRGLSQWPRHWQLEEISIDDLSSYL